MSAKVTRLALNPVVLTLAMLLPITSIRVLWLFSPETPENMERIITNLSFMFYKIAALSMLVKMFSFALASSSAVMTVRFFTLTTIASPRLM